MEITGPFIILKESKNEKEAWQFSDVTVDQIGEILKSKAIHYQLQFE